MKHHRPEILVVLPTLSGLFLAVKYDAESLLENAVQVGTLGLSPLIDRLAEDRR